MAMNVFQIDLNACRFENRQGVDAALAACLDPTGQRDHGQGRFVDVYCVHGVWFRVVGGGHRVHWECESHGVLQVGLRVM
jgi:hypothetical protein